MTQYKTLRQWAGLVPPTALQAATTALVLIDLQNEYFSGKLVIPGGERVVARSAVLLAWARQQRIMVVHVQHMAGKGGSQLFDPESSQVAFHEAVMPAAGETVVVKNLPNSFCKTDLHERLKERGIETLLLCGLMTHMCVDSTARGALEFGYRVIVAGDACASRDLPVQNGGGDIPHDIIHGATLAALGDRFADIMDVDGIMGLVVQ